MPCGADLDRSRPAATRSRRSRGAGFEEPDDRGHRSRRSGDRDARHRRRADPRRARSCRRRTARHRAGLRHEIPDPRRRLRQTQRHGRGCEAGSRDALAERHDDSDSMIWLSARYRRSFTEVFPMWIEHVEYAQSEGYLRTLYDRVKGHNGAIDNVMKVHSLRPHTMEGHSALYKSVLHHTGNALPVWFLECLGIYTSLAN